MHASSSHTVMPSRPPGAPWAALDPVTPATGYASYYYSDELGAWPVRAITRVGDNKSDPNLETGTYGLFSTCEQKMRSGIVTNRPGYIFFVTRRPSGPRLLTGYYELGWYAPGSLSLRIADFALAANRMRFIEPLPIPGLPDEIRAVLDGRWRLTKRLTAEQTEKVLRTVDAAGDRTADYLREVDRLERINLYHSGYRYPTWRRTDPFTWVDAARYLRKAAYDPKAPKILNSSPTGWWHCAHCLELTKNAALLKACPHCAELDTLRPAAPTDLMEAS
jgi:hypothetical protein